MICVGKSYWQPSSSHQDNKENVDNNVQLHKNKDKSFNEPRKPQLLKKISDQPTSYSHSSEHQSQDHELVLRKIYS